MDFNYKPKKWYRKSTCSGDMTWEPAPLNPEYHFKPKRSHDYICCYVPKIKEYKPKPYYSGYGYSTKKPRPISGGSDFGPTPLPNYFNMDPMTRIWKTYPSRGPRMPRSFSSFCRRLARGPRFR